MGRLDAAVAQACGVSVRVAKGWITQGRVRVAGRVVKAKGAGVQAGQAIVVDRPSDVILAEPGAMPVVLAEGAGWVVVDKPAGQAVHPLKPEETGTVLNGVAARWPGVRGVGEGGLGSGVVHRLDVPTSGCLAVATAQGAWDSWREAFTQGGVEKRYVALVPAGFEPRGAQAMWLKVTRHRPARVEPVVAETPGARACRLTVLTVEREGNVDRVALRLETGFLHQVRAMCAAWGSPVIGDVDYGGRAAERLMLHSAGLRCEAVGCDVGSVVPF